MGRRLVGFVLAAAVISSGAVSAASVQTGATASADATRGARVQITDPLTIHTGVTVQQDKLNELFAGYGIDPLEVDGDAGPVTRQRLCAFRMTAGLPVSTEPMAAGSAEERVLLSTKKLKIPVSSALLTDRWVLIDRTCQIMFAGRGADKLQFVLPVSTGAGDYPTRLQDRTRVFKYNPAASNGGWHDSSLYPSSDDNPLNGNMYKPLYFDRGQAIHGATRVPTYPASKGCVRLRPAHQNLLIDWLGLGGVRSITYDKSAINLSVNVQGTWRG